MCYAVRLPLLVYKGYGITGTPITRINDCEPKIATRCFYNVLGPP